MTQAQLWLNGLRELLNDKRTDAGYRNDIKTLIGAA